MHSELRDRLDRRRRMYERDHRRGERMDRRGRGRRDRSRGYPMDYEEYDDYNEYDEHNRPMGFYGYGIGGMYRDSRGYDSRGYDRKYEKDLEEDYKEDLYEWIEKMKRRETRFNLSMDQVIQQARSIGVRFDEFSEEEFYAVYLAMVTDYKSIGGDYMLYIKMAKDFLDDDDIKVSPSEKVCIYMYEIVMGEK